MKLAVLTFAAMAVAFAQAPGTPATDTAASHATVKKEAKKHKKHTKKADSAKPSAAVVPPAK